MLSENDKTLIVCHLVKNLGDVAQTAADSYFPRRVIRQMKSEIVYEFNRFYWAQSIKYRPAPPGVRLRSTQAEAELSAYLESFRLTFGKYKKQWFNKIIALADELYTLEKQIPSVPRRALPIDTRPLDALIHASSVQPDGRANVRTNVQPLPPRLPYHEDISHQIETGRIMYNNRDKARAIRNLIINLGDVQKTAEELHISERTIRRWKKTILREGRLIYWDEDQPPFQVYQRYERIRVSMLIETERLLTRMSEVNPLDAAEIATSVTRLTDRLAKIETVMERLGQYVIKIDTDILESLLITLDEKEKEEKARQQQEQQAADASKREADNARRRQHHRKKRRKRPPYRKKFPNTVR
jgi:hypothetical protein